LSLDIALLCICVAALVGQNTIEVRVYGLSKDLYIEKIFRDARAAMIEDGINETLALDASRRL